MVHPAAGLVTWLDNYLARGIHWPSELRAEMVERFVACAGRGLIERDELSEALIELEEPTLRRAALYIVLQDAYALWEITLFTCYEAWRERYPKLHEVFDPIPHLNGRYGSDFVQRAINEWHACHAYWAKRDKDYLYTLLQYDPAWLGFPGLRTLIVPDWAKQEQCWLRFSLRQRPDPENPDAAKTGHPKDPEVREKRELLAISYVGKRAQGLSVEKAISEINEELAKHGIEPGINNVDYPEHWLVRRTRLAEGSKALAVFNKSLFGKALQAPTT